MYTKNIRLEFAGRARGVNLWRKNHVVVPGFAFATEHLSLDWPVSPASSSKVKSCACSKR